MPYKNPEDKRRVQRKLNFSNYARIRRATISAYGGMCACCGEKEYDFLELDHIDDDGKDHRKRVGGSNLAVYWDLAKRGYPEGIVQVLCANCHLAKTKGIVCPHKR
jgi:hypothetical protein